ncbi:MAG: glycosyltransferase family A protein [bacterium]|nr:glycosyltransferase family A protein [bacterium]
MSNPFFSVVIPTYNRAAFIKKTVTSVLEQTFQDFEVLIIDDGSEDESKEVVTSIDDPRVRYFAKMNEERAVARNTGTDRSRGRYVTFLDSDDLLYPVHLDNAFQMIAEHQQPAWFHLGYEFVSGDSNSRSVAGSSGIANDKLIDGNFLSCRGVFLRRDVAHGNPFNPDRQLSGTEDYELWLRLASRFPLYCDERISSAIVQHDLRSVINADRAQLEKRIELLEKYLNADEEFQKVYSVRIPEFRANNRVYIALHLALGKKRIAAIGHLLRALGHSPVALRNRAFYGTLKRLFV